MTQDAPTPTEAATCPVMHGGSHGTKNQDWWPNQLDLSVLHVDTPAADPLGGQFDYPAAFAGLDLDALKADVIEVMTTSQPWWPADFGHYGPLFVRMAWHAAGTYRVQDGRGGGNGGQQRFAPLNSWPDNVNLDKARRLLWPVKKKYGKAISWADLIIYAGTVAQEHMGLPLFGFGFGRTDDWEPEIVNWGNETTWLADDQRYQGERELDNPLAAVQMGLIYVNPEGPGGNSDPKLAAHDIRETFARMAMNDEETVALIAGGHTFGKTHGAYPADNLGADPEAAPLQQMGLGWVNAQGHAKATDAITSGLEGTWTPSPIAWDNSFFETLFQYEWKLSKSPAGANQWVPVEDSAANTVPDAATGERVHTPVMLTTDLSLRFDPAYEPISRRFLENPAEFTDAYARAWFKLTHRDMGPVERYLGPWVPSEELLWQDPVPNTSGPLSDQTVAAVKAKALETGLSVSQLVATAWASASTFRSTDMRGGANGARVRLAPQNQWAVNDPAALSASLTALEGVQAAVNGAGGEQVSLADVIVLAGAAAVEKAAADAGFTVSVPVSTGRGDASQEQTDVESFAYLEPTTDGFRNYLGKLSGRPTEQLLIDRARLLGLSAPELTVLVGGLRVLGANTGGETAGVFTSNVGVLSNDFFVTVTDQGVTWTATSEAQELFTGSNGQSATRADLVFGSHSQLRAIAEFYACDDAKERFVHDFVAAWTKVMDADRFDLKS